jgi:hypothetical protein
MIRCRRRGVCLLVLATSVAAAMTACEHSSATQPSSGPASAPNPHARETDYFSYNVVSSSMWVIRSGAIAAYFIGAASHVGARGVVIGHPPPAPVTAQLLEDTIEVSDTLAGPPIGSASLLTPGYVAFDGGGNLWMSVGGSHGQGSVIEYTRAQTNQNGSLQPNATLSGSQTPLGLAFDAQGNLWVVDSAATALLEYSGIELETGGPPTKSISLAGITAAGATWAPLGVVVDAQGDVWISALPRSLPSGAAADSVPDFIVTEFSAAAIKGGGTPTPALTLVLAGVHPAGYGPGMAIDTGGNLWTLNADVGTLTQFKATSLTTGANPAPAITLMTATLFGAADVTIDSAGILYAGGSAYSSPGQGIFAYPPVALTTSGAPTPTLNYAPPGGLNHFAIR